MTAAEMLKECGFSSAEEVAALDGKFPGSKGLLETGNIGTGTLATFDYRGCRCVRLIKKGECDGTGS